MYFRRTSPIFQIIKINAAGNVINIRCQLQPHPVQKFMRNMVGRINIYKKLSGIFFPILAADNSEFVIHRSNLISHSLPMLLLFYTPACHKMQTNADNEQYRQNIFKVKHFYASPRQNSAFPILALPPLFFQSNKSSVLVQCNKPPVLFRNRRFIVSGFKNTSFFPHN